VNRSGRNDFTVAKIARDQESLYAYVRTAAPISPHTDLNWMRLLIAAGGAEHWEGFDYVVNRLPASGEYLTLERSTGGYEWQVVTDRIPYRVAGAEMELAIPLAALGLDPDRVVFGFKWDDNLQDPGDPLCWYTDGDTAPNGRFRYEYAEEGPEPDPPVVVELFDHPASDGSREPVVLESPADTAAVGIEAWTEFVGLDLAAWNPGRQPAGYSLKLYSDTGSYRETLAGEPVLTRTVANAYHNTPLYIGSERPLAKGRYVLVVSAPVPDPESPVGLWLLPGQTHTRAYVNGEARDGSSFQVRLHRRGDLARTMIAVSATSATNLSSLLGFGSESPWRTADHRRAEAEESLSLSVPEPMWVTGVRLVPHLENGRPVGFPRDFVFECRIPDHGHVPIDRQTYTGYQPTAAPQDFLFRTPVHTDFVTLRISGLSRVGDRYAALLSRVALLTPR
jgi:hypothetical protein